MDNQLLDFSERRISPTGHSQRSLIRTIGSPHLGQYIFRIVVRRPDGTLPQFAGIESALVSVDYFV